MQKAWRNSFLLLLCLLSACSSPGGGTKTVDLRKRDNNVAERRRQLRKNLQSLPYINAIPLPEEGKPREGVTFHDRLLACPGWNLFSPTDRAEAFLMDMNGKVIHKWSAPSTSWGWHYVEPDREGGLLAIVKDRCLQRLDRNSNLLWTKKLRFHHDIAIDANGDIYAPCNMGELVTLDGVEIPILDDSIMILSREGEIKRKLSLFELFGRLIPGERIRRLREWADTGELHEILTEPGGIDRIDIFTDTPPDVFHLNSIEIIDRELPGLCRRGDLLISVRELDTIAIIDPNEKRVLWSWGRGEIEAQHHASLLENGNILLFDNGVRRGYSRVLEIDPAREKIVWEYTDDPPEKFFSRSQGGSQRLPNGNTLITESDKGRAFEITPSGRIVWEYYAPIRILTVGGREKKMRVPIYRMTRITDPAALGLPPLPKN